MISKKSLSGLPRPMDLRSNKLKDLQDFFRKAFDELDKQWRLLHQDVSVIQLEPDGFIYFGGKDQLGTFRIGRVGDDYVLEHQTTTIGTWVRLGTTKGS